jgi:hypothetical protein
MSKRNQFPHMSMGRQALAFEMLAEISSIYNPVLDTYFGRQAGAIIGTALQSVKGISPGMLISVARAFHEFWRTFNGFTSFVGDLTICHPTRSIER